MEATADNSKCRACLTMDPLELFDWNEALLDNLTYEDCFRLCTQLDAIVDEPTMLCYKCSEELKCVYDFIQKTQQSDRELRLEKEVIDATESSRSLDECLMENLSSPPAHMSDESNDDSWDNLLNPSHEAVSSATDMSDESNDDSFDNSLNPNDEALTVDSYSSSLNEVKCRVWNRARFRGGSRKESVVRIDTMKLADITCPHCSKNFADEKKLKRHVFVCHKPKEHLCHACPRTFKNYTTLRLHTQTHEENRKRNYTCDHCGRKFFRQYSCQEHMKTHDPNRQPEFQCDQCEKSFTTKGSLNFHKKTHTASTIHECTICQKGFYRSTHLEIHMRIHSGDKPHKCSHCDKAFTHQSTLLHHSMLHTGMPLKCSLCGKGFVKKSRMRRHIGSVHKVEDIAERDKLTIKVNTGKWKTEDESVTT